ncbi:hypothetical protein D1AOALGA4SA_6150 [Olavius algarvensis Delta 1 endosymbiont]|nr:hypothetical protein D1AOALGA4SA_6150 [Olavius algarvensis Delta 1 endosymbiont]
MIFLDMHKNIFNTNTRKDESTKTSIFDFIFYFAFSSFRVFVILF